VELVTDSTKAIFTASHRIHTVNGVKRASELYPDHEVLVTGDMPERVTSVHVSEIIVDVVELVFNPDEPVEPFLPPPKRILSLGAIVKGCQDSRPRRTRRRYAAAKDGGDSIPATHDSWF